MKVADVDFRWHRPVGGFVNHSFAFWRLTPLSRLATQQRFLQ